MQRPSARKTGGAEASVISAFRECQHGAGDTVRHRPCPVVNSLSKLRSTGYRVPIYWPYKDCAKRFVPQLIKPVTTAAIKVIRSGHQQKATNRFMQEDRDYLWGIPENRPPNGSVSALIYSVPTKY